MRKLFIVLAGILLLCSCETPVYRAVVEGTYKDPGHDESRTVYHPEAETPYFETKSEHFPDRYFAKIRFDDPNFNTKWMKTTSEVLLPGREVMEMLSLGDTIYVKYLSDGYEYATYKEWVNYQTYLKEEAEKKVSKNTVKKERPPKKEKTPRKKKSRSNRYEYSY